MYNFCLTEGVMLDGEGLHRSSDVTLNMQAVGFTGCADNEERTSKVRSKPKATLFTAGEGVLLLTG